MKKKETKDDELKKEIKEEQIVPTISPFFGDSTWLMSLLALGLVSTPKSENKTTINSYTGSDK